MFESDKKSPLDRVSKSLYSRTDETPSNMRHTIHEGRTEVAPTWQEEKTPDLDDPAHMKATRKTYSYLFMSAFLFFIVAAIIGGYTLFGGRNFVSADNVNVLIEGPTSISGGEPLTLNISVVNRNATNIENVDLIVEYPDGTKDSTNASLDLSRLKIPLGNIKSQSLAQKEISSIMFGEEGAMRNVKFRVEYQTENSNATFYKEKEYSVSISSSPVTVTISGLEKVLGGQSSDFTVTVASNTTIPVRDVLVSLDYPFGFKVVSANPQPSFGNSVWKIGDLAPGTNRTIKLQATIEGQNDEERILRANVGIQSATNEREIATNIVSRDHSFVIEKPFLGLDVTLDGNRGDIAANPGRAVRAEIIWTNNSADRITGARIEAKLSGNVLNKSSVIVDGGFYDSLTDTIVWEAGRTFGLDNIAPGENGRVNFSFSSTNASPGQSVLNPQMSVTVSAKGGRVDSSGVPQEITSAVTRSVKLLSNLTLSNRALRSQGPISNTGPVPPRAEQVTTYTIVWTVTNTSNNITGAKVTASLPPYVSWTDTISPSDAQITYNPTGGTLVWNVGSIPRNTDTGGGKQVSFQVALRPSLNQVGSVPQLITNAKITGTDSFTGVVIENSAPALTTRTSSDSLYQSGDEIVQN